MKINSDWFLVVEQTADAFEQIAGKEEDLEARAILDSAI